MKTKHDELLNLYALWANSTDDIDDILDDIEQPVDDTACAHALTTCERWDELTDLPF